jgi:arsenate reductase (thioredoxin)
MNALNAFTAIGEKFLARCATIITRNCPDGLSMTSSTRMRVLFVCIGNACRSPMAESIARRDAPDIIDPSSAGLYPLGHLAPPTMETLTANDYSLEGLSSKCITREAVQRADVIVNISGAPLDHLFAAGTSRLRPEQRLENWDISDPYGEDSTIYQRILEQLERRVQELAARLREANRTAHA